jgi:dienelactone hydrolase
MTTTPDLAKSPYERWDAAFAAEPEMPLDRWRVPVMWIAPKAAVGARGLVHDSRAFAEAAREAGVDVRLDIFPGQQHTFQMAAGRSPDADEAIRRLADWVRPQLGL